MDRFETRLDADARKREPCDVLIAAAFAPELVGLATLLGPAMTDAVGGLTVAARPVGIGLVASGCGATATLLRMQPRGVVLVGTCGAYPGSGLGIGDLVVARSIHLVEPAAFDQEAAIPEPMPTRLEAHPSLGAALASAGRARLADVGTTLGITTSDALASRLARGSSAAVEHLEAFAVATACAAQQVPFAAVLAVANGVGSMGREQWRASHQAAGRAASGFVATWLKSGAAGLPARSG